MDRADLTYVASLVGGIFGKGGGGEFANARWLREARSEVRRDEGRARGLRRPAPEERPRGADHGHDSLSRTAAPGIRPVERRVSRCPTWTARPRPGTGDPSRTPVAAGDAARRRCGSDSPASRRSPRSSTCRSTTWTCSVGPGMSNALLVGADKHQHRPPAHRVRPADRLLRAAAADRAGAEGPGVKARGVSFAGTQLVVQLGRGVDYAWSATSASNDNVDTVVERLCNADGTRRRCTSTSYLGREVRADGVDESQADGRPEPRRRPSRRGNPRSQVCAPSTASSSRAPRSTARRWRSSPSAAPTATRSTRSSGSPAQRPGLRTTRRRSSGPPSAHRLHVQLVLRRRPGHLLLQLRTLPQRAAGTDFDLPRWGDATLRLEGLAAVRPTRAPDQPADGLPRELEQQAGARLVGRGQRLGLRRRLPQPRTQRPRPGRHRDGRRSRAPSSSASSRTRPPSTRGPGHAAELLEVIGEGPARRGHRGPAQAWLKAGRAPGRPRPRRRLRAPAGHRRLRRVVGVAEHVDTRREVGREGRAAAAARHARRRSCRRTSTTTRAAVAARPGTGRLVRLREQRPARAARSRRDVAVLPGLLRSRLAGPVPDRLRASLEAAVDRVLAAQGQTGRRPDLRQAPGRHPARDRRPGGRPADRLAEPADLPAGGRLPQPPLSH